MFIVIKKNNVYNNVCGLTSVFALMNLQVHQQFEVSATDLAMEIADI